MYGTTAKEEIGYGYAVDLDLLESIDFRGLAVTNCEGGRNQRDGQEEQAQREEEGP